MVLAPEFSGFVQLYSGGPNVDVSAEADDEGLSEADVRAQYETDWTEWPADLGAPYFDANGNGIYDATPIRLIR